MCTKFNTIQIKNLYLRKSIVVEIVSNVHIKITVTNRMKYVLKRHDKRRKFTQDEINIRANYHLTLLYCK